MRGTEQRSDEPNTGQLRTSMEVSVASASCKRNEVEDEAREEGTGVWMGDELQ